jgi:pantetheine-phosphate adenylyltransferase
LITALYAGSFDPITNGHIDIATRASELFDRIVIGIFATPDKRLAFTTEERVDLARRAVAHLKKVEVMAMMNRLLSPDLELVCFMASQQYQFLSARLIKEVASLGGDINGLVPKHVAEALKNKGVSP